MGKGKDFRGYVFGATMASLAMAAVPDTMKHADAQVTPATAADFTFSTSLTTNGTITATTGAKAGPFIAESGTGSAYGMHASASTVYSAPSGNGSPHSFSSNHFAVGDYYEFAVDTTTLATVVLSFDQVSSGTGPKAFNLEYSSDGVATDTTLFTNYAVGTASFSSSAANPAAHFVFDLSSVTAVASDPSALFFLVDNDSTAASATGGTDRVDNFLVTNTVPTPEPGALTLTAFGASLLLLPRRRKLA